MVLLPDPDYELLPAVSASFDPETGIVQILLDKVTYHYADRPVEYQGKLFQPKKELRVTLISQDAPILTRHLKTYPDDAQDIQELVQAVAWNYRKQGKYFYVEAPRGAESIIELVDVPDLTQFLKDLSKLVSHGFMLASTHVTLYTRGDEDTGLPTQAAVERAIKADIPAGRFY